MSSDSEEYIVIPEVSVYEAHRDKEILLKDVCLDAQHASDAGGKVLYFTFDDDFKEYVRREILAEIEESAA